MGDMADWHLEQMLESECEYCGALYPDNCDLDCKYRDSDITDEDLGIEAD